MDADLLIIFPGIIVMLMILGISVNGIVSKVLKHKRWEREQELRKSNPQSSMLEDRTDLIEDRLRVLERLATDRGTLLSDEIEALRESSAINNARREGLD